jgi:type II secretory pathway pseudopilin PulG
MRSRNEAGYTLVAVVIGIAILTILIAAVAPSIATIMKREKEDELIFRGRQYARAIALFQRRYGRFPNELKELYENRPRTIRHLWKDPVCNCDWQPLIQGTPDALPSNSVMPGAPPPTPTPKSVFGPADQPKTVGPIIGVRSTIHKEALRQWRGSKFYDEWRFIVGDADRDVPGGGGASGPPAPGPIKPGS